MPSTPATADVPAAGHTPMTTAAVPVLEIEDLSVRFATPDGEIGDLSLLPGRLAD